MSLVSLLISDFQKIPFFADSPTRTDSDSDRETTTKKKKKKAVVDSDEGSVSGSGSGSDNDDKPIIGGSDGNHRFEKKNDNRGCRLLKIPDYFKYLKIEKNTNIFILKNINQKTKIFRFLVLFSFYSVIIGKNFKQCLEHLKILNFKHFFEIPEIAKKKEKKTLTNFLKENYKPFQNCTKI